MAACADLSIRVSVLALGTSPGQGMRPRTRADWSPRDFALVCGAGLAVKNDEPRKNSNGVGFFRMDLPTGRGGLRRAGYASGTFQGI